MIGIIAKPGQAAVVTEFFELFKTPWEFYRADKQYSTVLATADEIPTVNTKLLLVFGAAKKDIDERNGILACSTSSGGVVECQGATLPIRGELAVFKPNGSDTPFLFSQKEVVALKTEGVPGRVILRFGYDLFEEVRLLLSGQPIEQAPIPTLDIHIAILRDVILREGIAILEIPPVPAGYSFSVCLTHDIDFVGIRNHKWDHTVLGFLYRATFGATRSLLLRKISFGRFLDCWRAALSLPFVLLGWKADFWEPFAWYLRVEENLPATYFVIPFKRRAGDRVSGRRGYRRATAYDIGDIKEWIDVIRSSGNEVGVHGIDAWHSVEKGRAELTRIAKFTGESEIGIRVHWLLRDAHTTETIENSGFAYDSTEGYNETIGYYAGTSQVYRPLGTNTLLEVPMHIQDGAIFFPHRLGLSEQEATQRCREMIENTRNHGGVLTVLWHDRSHGPERFWGDFYIQLVQTLKASNAWFGTASQVVDWFRRRRGVRFEQLADNRVVVSFPGEVRKESNPPLQLRIYHPRPLAGTEQIGASPEFEDIPWNGDVVECDLSHGRISNAQYS